MHVLVTVLGKGRKSENGVARYEQANYAFPDGSVRSGAFFGLLLAQSIKPQRLVVLGTEGSMWDELVSAALSRARAPVPSIEALQMELMEAVDAGKVSAELLQRAERLLAEALDHEVVLKLFPAGIDVASQMRVIEVIADGVRGATRASIDVTHGFRYMGMLGFLSAFALTRMVPEVNVESVWYGAYDMRMDNVSPVVKLDGLLGIQRWVDALNRFEVSGNYGVFAPLLEADGMPADKAKCLQDAAFLEFNFNLRDAQKKLSTVREALGAPMTGASGLFQQRLIECMDWIRIQNPQDQHFWLAERAMDRDDFGRAAILALEGFRAGLAWNKKMSPWDYASRKAASDEFEDGKSKSPGWDSYKVLRGIRNLLIHGTQFKWEAKAQIDGKSWSLDKVISNRELLRKALQQSMQGLRKAMEQE